MIAPAPQKLQLKKAALSKNIESSLYNFMQLLAYVERHALDFGGIRDADAKIKSFASDRNPRKTSLFPDAKI